jgi:hypothetical protein
MVAVIIVSLKNLAEKPIEVSAIVALTVYHKTYPLRQISSCWQVNIYYSEKKDINIHNKK